MPRSSIIFNTQILANDAQELTPYRFEFKTDANRIRIFLSAPRFEPGSLGWMTDTLANSAMPQLFLLLSLKRMILFPLLLFNFAKYFLTFIQFLNQYFRLTLTCCNLNKNNKKLLPTFFRALTKQIHDNISCLIIATINFGFLCVLCFFAGNQQIY